MADLFATAEERAFVLARTGLYPTWPRIAEQLAKEHYAAKAIARIGRNRETQRAMAACILEAEKALEHEQSQTDAKRIDPSLRPDAFMGRRC
jgi:hypothetical protein